MAGQIPGVTRFAATVCTLAVLALTGCGDESAGGPVTLDWFIFNEPSGAPVRIAERCSQESGGRYDIEFRYLPSSADAQREQLVRRLAAEDDTIDLIGSLRDLAWAGAAGRHRSAASARKTARVTQNPNRSTSRSCGMGGDFVS